VDGRSGAKRNRIRRTACVTWMTTRAPAQALRDNEQMSLPRHRLTLHRLGSLVLVWFALTLGAAIAAPLVAPGSFQLVCSAGGSVRLAVDGDRAATTPTLDCPLCLAAGAPPPAAVVAAGVPGAPESLASSGQAQRTAQQPARSWQARAPPVA